MILTITDSTGDSIDVELPDDWVNYWDINPQQHGGLFTQFEDSGVTALETIPPSSIPDDVYEDRHLVYEHYGRYDELWTTIDGQDYPSEILGRELDARLNGGTLQQAAVDGMLPSSIAWCLTRTRSGREKVVPDNEYTETMTDYYSVPKELL